MLPLPFIEASMPGKGRADKVVPGRMITIFNPHGPANESCKDQYNLTESL